MSKERKLLKIICFLYVLDAIAFLVFGGIMLAGMSLLDPADTVAVGGIDFNLQAWSIIFGIWGIVSGIFYLIYAFAGIRGANTPRKIGPFRVMSLVAVIFAVIGMLLGVALDGVSTDTVLYVVSLVFAIACFVLSGKIKEQAER
ncbi:MAG TPA: hypothetical protein IAA43_03580 [Candidatus Olsenella avicola]|uniref:hypothetical protein n=1 Tax=Olsenella sp. An285 TaxID=1965621 RepID=UPI000B371160|nr:hypothetical protein [Olsenella sp. An285]OUO47462.1 hypothetical protein B5F79_03750 [Olsenella sp. An285]HIY51007.1 hypothetical protein [Candidatus Olsenella avicola]